ncbi:MAG: hydroxyisourate hydrolase [Rhizobiales bacterium]|nr:hydroxyisourate hydrolase [Hyphomicrobiales bacterium]
MPGLSIHIVDVTRGVVAEGMRVEVYALGNGLEVQKLIADGQISAKGQLEDPALNAILASGQYRALFHVSAYYRRSGVSLPNVPFLDVVSFDFGISDSQQHYHLPFKCTPWGYSCFRGGA